MQSLTNTPRKRKVKTDGMMWISSCPGISIVLVPSGAKVPKKSAALEILKKIQEAHDARILELRAIEDRNHRNAMAALAERYGLDEEEVEERWNSIMSQDPDYVRDFEDPTYEHDQEQWKIAQTNWMGGF